MKRFRPSVRRVLTIAAAAVAGVGLTLVVASPASAHANELNGSAKCLPNGTWDVKWSIHNDDSHTTTLSNVVSDPQGSAITNSVIENGTTLAGDETLSGHQSFPGSETTATLSFHGTWSDGFPNDGQNTDESKTVHFYGTCDPAYTVALTCDKITFTFEAQDAPAVVGDAAQLQSASTTVSVVLTPHPAGDPVTFTLPLPAGGPDKVVALPGGPGTSVDVAIGDFKATVTWTGDPCPSLPTTGSSLTGPVGIGGGLLVGGIALIALLFVMRRRRTVAGS